MERGFFHYVWRYSRREQLFVLALVLISLPFYWASFDVPKQIVNNAIQGRAFTDGRLTATLFEISFTLPALLGGARIQIFEGLSLTQFWYLMALSVLFLVYTLINGAFKYIINLRKGILGERMLRRLRYELFTMVMRFRPEDMRATKSAEISSMIKDEVEPIGGFFGEAFITPAFLGMQAATALLFIMAQNLTMGVLAALIIAVQGLVIPRLRREQLRLARLRQIASRKLAGRVSEMVDAAPMLHAFALVPYTGAEIGDRLAKLFDIRLQLYRRKFSVKFLNNLLAQVTPFIFYTIGGYLALNGRLDIGQLVAVIAAYRDLPGPIKELIDWDQQSSDVQTKFEQVVEQFARPTLLPVKKPVDLPAEDAPINIKGLSVKDGRGITLLDPLSLTIARPSHIALIGPSGGARDLLPKVLGRQMTDYAGEVEIAGQALSHLPDAWAAKTLLYVGNDPHIVSGTIRENICLAAFRALPEVMAHIGKEHLSHNRLREAEVTATPLVSSEQDWTDYAALGIDGPEKLEAAIITALRQTQAYDGVFEAGLAAVPGTFLSPEDEARFLAARRAMQERLTAENLTRLVEHFDVHAYNETSSIGQNLLFGVALGGQFKQENITKNSYFLSILDAEGLTEPLARVGLRMIEAVMDVFAGLTAESPLLARYSFIQPHEGDAVNALIREARRYGQNQIPPKTREKLIGYSLHYVETRHRLGLMNEALRRRLLRARRSFRTFIPARESADIAFYEQDVVMRAAPIRDNLLFGRIAYGAKAATVNTILANVVAEQGLESFVIHQGLSQEAGPGGRLLSPQQRARIALARALLVKPSMLVLDDALLNFSAHDANIILENLRKAMEGHTLVVTLPEQASTAGFDRVLSFAGTKLAEDKMIAEERNAA